MNRSTAVLSTSTPPPCELAERRLIGSVVPCAALSLEGGLFRGSPQQALTPEPAGCELPLTAAGPRALASLGAGTIFPSIQQEAYDADGTREARVTYAGTTTDPRRLRFREVSVASTPSGDVRVGVEWTFDSFTVTVP